MLTAGSGVKIDCTAMECYCQMQTAITWTVVSQRYYLGELMANNCSSEIIATMVSVSHASIGTRTDGHGQLFRLMSRLTNTFGLRYNRPPGNPPSWILRLHRMQSNYLWLSLVYMFRCLDASSLIGFSDLKKVRIRNIQNCFWLSWRENRYNWGEISHSRNETSREYHQT